MGASPHWSSRRSPVRSIPAAPGSDLEVASEYVRCGTCSIVVWVEHLRAPPVIETSNLPQRPEIHHTPGHGSWLNIAEIGLSALTRRCLDRRIADLEVRTTELAAWQAVTNADQRQVNRHFTTSDARTRLRHLYPERRRRRPTGRPSTGDPPGGRASLTMIPFPIAFDARPIP